MVDVSIESLFVIMPNTNDRCTAPFNVLNAYLAMLSNQIRFDTDIAMISLTQFFRRVLLVFFFYRVAVVVVTFVFALVSVSGFFFQFF